MKNYYANLLKTYNHSELYGHLWELNCATELDCYRNDFKENYEPLSEDEFEKLCQIIYDYVMEYEYATPVEIIYKLTKGIENDEFTLEDILEENEIVDEYIDNSIWED